MERLGPVVATVSATTARAATTAARAAMAAGADRVEVRLDHLAPGEDPLSLLDLSREMPLLVSGRRDRLQPEELPVLKRGQERGVWVDVPFTSDLAEGLHGLDPSRLVLSWHEFEGIPADLGAVLSRMRSRRAATYKIVTTAGDFPDTLSVLRFLEQVRRGDLCAFAMGGAGLASRILALAWGSCATYAAAPGCDPAASGQMGLEEFLRVYRPREIHRDTLLFALAGWPLAHTQTPSFFNPWLEGAGLPGRYVPFPCMDPRDLIANGLPLGGVAVTVPHKETALRLAARTSRLARTAGACNTLLPGPDGWLAANTDVWGVRCALRRVPRGSRALLVGCGGAACAAALVLRGRGPVAVCARDDSKAEAFARRWALEAIPWDKRAAARWDLLVNATPVGSLEDETPYPLKSLCGRWVFDMVVRSNQTALLKAAAARGVEVIPGHAMLVPQAALQFRLWTGRRAPGRVKSKK